MEALGAICGSSGLPAKAGGTCGRPSPRAAEERGRPGCGLGECREPGLRHVLLLATALGWGSLGSVVFKEEPCPLCSQSVYENTLLPGVTEIILVSAVCNPGWP